MIENLAEKIVNWQIKKQYLPEKDSKLYTYAYGLLIGQIVNFLIACLLAIFFDAYLIVFVYMIFFIPLRSYAGGHHADNYQICTIISTIMLCAVCLMARVIPLEFIIVVNIAVSFLSGGLIFLFAPVQDSQKPLDSKERKRYRKFSIFIWIIETSVWIVLYFFGAKLISLAIILNHLSVAVLLFMGIIKNNRINKIEHPSAR